VVALAEFLFGERRIGRVDDRHTAELAMCLGFAVHGQIATRTLARPPPGYRHGAMGSMRQGCCAP
jgi:hypothetical protein